MKSKTKNSIGIRIAAMLLDHFIMTFSIILLAFLLVGIGYLIVGDPAEADLPKWCLIFPLFFGLSLFSIYMNKDAIKGKSPAKRLLGLILVNHKTGEIANPIKSVIRNITLLIWPIEAIFVLFSPERRLGDYIAGTRVIIDDDSLETELKMKHLILSLFLGILFMFLMAGLQLLVQGIKLFHLI